ncbi:MAG: T9SS type A sorting domain-containing protein [Ignavibacteria bacterium]|jgi:hypothetical protein
MEKKSTNLENKLLFYSVAAGSLFVTSSNIFGQLATLNNGETYDVDFDGSGAELQILFNNKDSFWLRSFASNVSVYGNKPAAFALPYNLTSGNTINTTQNWQSVPATASGYAILDHTAYGGHFDSTTFGSNHYFGVRFNNGAGLKYGWVRIELNSSGQLVIHDQQYGDTPPAPLPVELTFFSASIFNNSVQLLWDTATEINNYGFEIERKELDQIAGSLASEWEKIGFVNGHGNSNSPKSYSFIDGSPLSTKAAYRLKQIDFDGTFDYSNVIEVTAELPAEYELKQNYPNPFNPETTINFALPETQLVNLSIYNILGEKIKELVNEELEPGFHSVFFDGSGLASGTYIYRLETNNFSQVKKMLLVK